jgi:hypothetical protein
MNRQTFGFLSLLLILAAVLTAAYAIYQYSFFWTLLYLVGLMLSSLVIIFSFCTKCPSRDKDCSHVLPGKLARFFPRREEEAYTLRDKAGVVVPLVFAIVYPQYWLLIQPAYFVLFAALCLGAAAMIQFFVCKGCTNCYCPFFQGECRMQ